MNLLKSTLMFRTWIVRHGHPVGVCKCNQYKLYAHENVVFNYMVDLVP